MAKINNTEKRNTNRSPKGTMPKDMLNKFKLKGNLADPPIYVTRDARKIARSVRMVSTYRQLVHGAPPKLPSSLRTLVHYFLVPLSRTDSDNPRDNNAAAVINNT